MNEPLLLVGAGAVFAVIALFVKEQKKEYGILVSLTASLFVLTLFLKYVPKITGFANIMIDNSGIDKDGFAILFKVMGVALLTELSMGICKDCGENALAVKVEIAGKLVMLLFALPLFEKVLKLVLSV